MIGAYVCQIEIEKSRPIAPVTEESQDTVDADNGEDDTSAADRSKAGGRREGKKRAAPRTSSKRSRFAR